MLDPVQLCQHISLFKINILVGKYSNPRIEFWTYVIFKVGNTYVLLCTIIGTFLKKIKLNMKDNLRALRTFII